MQFNGFTAGTPAIVGQPPVLQVTGEGQLEVAPDTALITLGFTTRAPQAAAAFQQTAAALNRVVQALLGAGLTREQLQTQQISLQPVIEREQVVGYEATSTLRVTLRDLAGIGAVIDRAVAAGANNVQGISFEVRDRAAPEARALSLAVQDAQRMAAALAASLGIRLGRLWRVEAEPGGGPIGPFFARAAALEALPVLPGTVTFTRRVLVQYVIQQP